MSGLNITEEDLIKTMTAQDIMAHAVPLIQERLPLPEILRIFSEHENLYYPVIDSQNALSGIITVDMIKNALMVADLNQLLVAHDLMEAVPVTASPETSMVEVKGLLKRYKVEYLPIVTPEKHIAGFLEARTIERLISRKYLELQRKSDALG